MVELFTVKFKAFYYSLSMDFEKINLLDNEIYSYMDDSRKFKLCINNYIIYKNKIFN